MNARAADERETTLGHETYARRAISAPHVQGPRHTRRVESEYVQPSQQVEEEVQYYSTPRDSIHIHVVYTPRVESAQRTLH